MKAARGRPASLLHNYTTRCNPHSKAGHGGWSASNRLGIIGGLPGIGKKVRSRFGKLRDNRPTTAAAAVWLYYPHSLGVYAKHISQGMECHNIF